MADFIIQTVEEYSPNEDEVEYSCELVITNGNMKITKLMNYVNDKMSDLDVFLSNFKRYEDCEYYLNNWNGNDSFTYVSEKNKMIINVESSSGFRPISVTIELEITDELRYKIIDEMEKYKTWLEKVVGL